MTIPKQFTAEAADYREIRKAFWRQVSRDSQSWGGYYRSRLCVLYKNIIPPGARVLEIGCGIGDLLAAVNPAVDTVFPVKPVGHNQLGKVDGF